MKFFLAIPESVGKCVVVFILCGNSRGERHFETAEEKDTLKQRGERCFETVEGKDALTPPLAALLLP